MIYSNGYVIYYVTIAYENLLEGLRDPIQRVHLYPQNPVLIIKALTLSLTLPRVWPHTRGRPGPFHKKWH